MWFLMLPTVNIYLCSLCRALGFRHCSLSMLHLFSPHTPKLPFIMTKVGDMSVCTFVLIWGHRVVSNEDLIEIDKAILTNQRKPYETKIKKCCWALQGPVIRNWGIGNHFIPLCYSVYPPFPFTFFWAWQVSVRYGCPGPNPYCSVFLA